VVELLELGTVSSRGQIAIPSGIRKEMGLSDFSRVVFFLEDDTLLIKKLTSDTWEQITKPLKEQKKKISQPQVNDLIHKLRKK